jgi:hypothetical protein
MKLNVRDNKEICHITLDELVCPELDSASNDYISVLKHVTNISIVNTGNSSYIINAKQEHLNDIFADLKSFGYRLAVLWAEGNMIDEDLDADLITCANEWDDSEWATAGHILDRKNNMYPTFHNQCVVINLKTATYLNPKGIVNDYVASSEHMHDDYTPTWIKGVSDRIPNSSVESYNVFDMLMRMSINNEQLIYNLPFNVRKKKICVYPEDDIQWAQEAIFEDYSKLTEQQAMAKIYDIRDNYPDKKPLFDFKVMEHAVVYITNTEDVPPRKDSQINVGVFPCSGIHQFKHIANNINTMEKVIWADFSTYAINWMTIVVNEWDGQDFTKFYKDNIHRINFAGNAEFDEDLVVQFYESFADNEWLAVWHKIQSLDHVFLKVNLIEQYDMVLHHIPKNKNVLLQCSNIWLYEENYINRGFKATHAVLDYIKLALDKSNKVIFVGDANGTFYDLTNIGRNKWI